MERFSRSLYYALTTLDIRKMIEDIISEDGFLKEVSYSDIENTPTTLDGYGITDAVGSITLNGVSHMPINKVVNLGMSSYNELIIGNFNAATTNWTGVSSLPSASDFVSGYRFTFFAPYSGATGGVTLTLTFQDNSTKTVDLYYKGTTRLTTHFGAGAKIDFVYLENANIGGTTLTGCWPHATYYSDTVTARGLLSYYERGRLYSNTNPLYRYKICGYHDGYIVPVVITNQTSTTQVNKKPTSVGLDVSRGLVYYNGTTDYTTNRGALGANILQESAYITTCAYTFNVTMPKYSDVFLCGKSFDGKYLYLDDTLTGSNYRSYYVYADRGDTDAHALTANYYANFVAGKYYWYVGSTYSTNNYMQIKTQHPLYFYDGTDLIQVCSESIDSPKYVQIPTVAPTNPILGKTYMYYDETNHQLCVIESDGTTYKTTLTT